MLETHAMQSLSELPVRTLPCRIARIDRLSHDVMGLWLQLPRTERLPYYAGQYVDVLLRDGRRRSFSLANAPQPHGLLELHVRHYPHGAFSDHVFSDLREQALVRIRGPLGNFRLNEAFSLPVIFVAGGTGFAPLKAIIEYSLAEGIVRPMTLYWGARAKCDLYMDELARRWTEQHAHIRYIPVLSEPLPEEGWCGRTGFVHEAVLTDYRADRRDVEVYASGPPVMVYAVRDAFLENGLASDRIYSDAFEFAAN
jgi:CDP-4-dehydro-6-deoxyglucose reductase